MEEENYLTREETVELIGRFYKDPEQGLEYLHGLDVNGLYREADIMRFINRGV